MRRKDNRVYHFFFYFLLCAVFFAVAATDVTAQKQPPSENNAAKYHHGELPELRVGVQVDLVTLYASVVDGKDHFVYGLDQNNFRS